MVNGELANDKSMLQLPVAGYLLPGKKISRARLSVK
jgi:hypothetical protein